MSDDLHNVYKDAKDKLISFLQDCSINTIKFHQFGFLIMYFPIYMIIHDLRESESESGYTGEILFEEKENDKKINEDMIINDLESFNVNGEKNTLDLGLCEPVVFNEEEKNENGDGIFKNYEPYDLKKDDNSTPKKELLNKCVRKLNNGKESYFMHLPFINFPPVYGVSLINNPKINKIKREKRKDSIERDNEKFLSIIDYWRHFSAKLSLLDKDDFKKLKVSLYEEGSTTDWFIRERLEFKTAGITCVNDINNEFKDLFKGDVDVAFTIQPWAALPASEFQDPPLDVDIVYKNVCTEFNCTSLIFKTSKKEYLIIGDYILNCFNILLKIKIKNLYEMNSDDIKESIKHYCELLMSHCKKQDKKTINPSQIDMEKWCLFENKMALRLTIDSQIYKYLSEIKKEDERMNDQDVIANYFVEKYGGSSKGIDEFQKLLAETCGEIN